ncbi:MAG: NAD(P)-dependent oxidoreductase [Saprospiraceae bacterium]|nr:NAD(P)-dependent oxidoreductase [Candidatus Opimibacter iunctus]
MEDTSSAVWVDEELPAIPRDIYDITKLTGENLCKDFFEKEGLNGCVLRVSRFMEEPENSIANYRLYRGLDERDGAMAHWLALHKRFKSYEIFNISNDTSFTKADLIDLKHDPRKVILRYYPTSEEIYNRRQWTFPQSIDRVYAIDKAKRLLGYRPGNNFMEYISGLSI